MNDPILQKFLDLTLPPKNPPEDFRVVPKKHLDEIIALLIFTFPIISVSPYRNYFIDHNKDGGLRRLIMWREYVDRSKRNYLLDIHLIRTRQKEIL